MVSIRSRASWGARAPSGTIHTVAPSSRTGFVLHYSLGPTSQTVRQIQDYHLDGQGWSDIGYNLLVDEDGTAYVGRGWDAIGAHAAGANTSNYGCCYIGSDGMTDAAMATVVELYDEACERSGRTLSRLGHRDLGATTCPGDDNYGWWTSAGFRDVSGAAAGGEDDEMLGLKRGDKGRRVSYLQYMIRLAGAPYSDLLGTWGLLGDGVDGDYGADTARALLRLRQDYGSSATDGDSVTHYAAGQVHAMVARAQAGR